MSNRTKQLCSLGQSVWYDFIRRDMLRTGGLEQLVESGVTGVTSNPAIFEKAIAGSTEYDEALVALAGRELDIETLFESLAIEDIQGASDVLRPVHDQTGCRDGFVSLEVSPELADDTAGTVHAARRLWKAVDRPNLMMKVPGTDAGFPAIETLISEGINVNVTLLFSLEAYEKAVNAFLAGLEHRKKNGDDLSRVASVASFFVSRVDTAVDRWIDEKGKSGDASLAALKGKAAVANAKLAYEIFGNIFTGDRFEALDGAQRQRIVWASTSTKNPAYRDVLYVEELIGRDTVNTVPPDTLAAFEEHGEVRLTLTEGLDEARRLLRRLGEAGIDFDAVTDTLLMEGVEAFKKPYRSLLAELEAKCSRLLAERS